MAAQTRNFFRCNVCGNLVGLIQDGGGKLVCCGTEMEHLIANTVDASHEKHVPVVQKNGNELTVTVGSALHPMIPEHHIVWIAVVGGDKTQRISLDPTGHPGATFMTEGSEVTVYAYCNLHGLWMG